ncbi:polysaccharide lyase [Frigidibacter sp. MR17.14]|uniref:polysaccharide lyase n=1 Tax=Frigidibacter sp. MR17.14 TaxID=3126509 RepID=UPI003012B048
MRRHLAMTVLALIWPLSALAQDDPRTLRLVDGFDGADFSAEGGLYYRENSEQSAGSVLFQSTVRDAGAGALQLSVRPHCPPGSEGCSERAEIWEKTPLRVPYDEGVWYGFAMRFDDRPPTDDHRYVVAQWKREIGPEAEGDFSPFLALRMRSGQVFVTVETNYQPPPAAAPAVVAGRCPAGWTPVWLRPETAQMRYLVAVDAAWTPEVTPEFDHCTDALVLTGGTATLPHAAPDWHDYAFYTRPGPNGGGEIRILVDGAPLLTARGRIGHDDTGLGRNQYFKFGPYRDAGEGEWTMFYDSFRRGPDCRSILPEAACAGQE